MLIDWHSHHTAPELVDEFSRRIGRTPHIDAYDSPDFTKRVSEMGDAGIDIQLVCQGAALDADQLPAEQAIEIARKSNDLIAERIGSHSDRLMGVIALSLKNVDWSVNEIQRMVAKGFRAVLLYPRVDGDMMVDLPDLDPVFATVAELGLPIFLHGSGAAKDPSLKRLEDGGAGVSYSVLADANVNECIMRMIAGGVFDRHPDLHVVIRSGGGGIPLLVGRMFWKHKGPRGEERYLDIFMDHFLIDTASVKVRTLPFLIDTLGEERVVFGSDYCGGLGPLQKALSVIEQQTDSASVRSSTERNSRRLLRI
jgi:predicted TIM-barrel fold metal-dependent hydrolase